MTNNVKKYSYNELKDDLGRYRTQSLFWELRFREDEEKYPCFFTLKDYDLEKEGILYPSLKKIYLSYDHIPEFEYEFALDVFNSWDHWQRLANDTVPMIKKEIKAWREELDIRIKASALKALIATARLDDSKGFNAAKYLADKGYSTLTKRGRPSSEEVERELRVQAGASKELEEDMKRLGLSVVNGGQ